MVGYSETEGVEVGLMSSLKVGAEESVGDKVGMLLGFTDMLCNKVGLTVGAKETVGDKVGVLLAFIDTVGDSLGKPVIVGVGFELSVVVTKTLKESVGRDFVPLAF